MRIRIRIPRLLRSENGAVAVEFALIAPVFLLLCFGIVDFSRAYYTLNAVSSAVREGARAAAVFKNPTTTDLALIQDEVLYYMNSFGGTPLTRSMITVQTAVPAGAPPGTNPYQVTVSVVNYPWQPITPIPNWGILNGGPYMISRSATFRWEWATCAPAC